MIEVTLLNYLKNALNVPVFMEMPSNPEQLADTGFVLFEVSSWNRRDNLCHGIVSLQVYAKSKYEASVLNESVISVMDSARDNLNDLSQSALNTAGPSSDTSIKLPCYRATYDITFYKED